MSIQYHHKTAARGRTGVVSGGPDDLVAQSSARVLQLFEPRALLLFGSCLSPETRQPSSIPDLFAIVDDLDEALRRAGAARTARWAARVLPPITVSLRAANDREIAKLNLIDRPVLMRELRTVPDLYLAGRLSKRSRVLHTTDAPGTAALLDEAALVMARAGLLAPPRRFPVEAAVRRCLDLSYLAELRPESGRKRDALYTTFARWYMDRYRPLLAAQAQARGLALEGEVLLDDRTEAVRAAEALALRRLLRRCRLRCAARWPKQALVYRGWLPYLVGKLRRARS